MSDEMPESQQSVVDLPPLPDKWEYTTLADLLEPNGLSYGIVQPGFDTPGGIPIVRVKNLRNNQVETANVLRVSSETEEKYLRTRLKGGELLLSLVGSVGEVALAPSSLAGWNVARAIAVIRTRDDVNSWLKYYLSSQLAQNFMNIRQTTTVQATLNLRDVRRVPIAMPPDSERKAILSLVQALDDKIVVNDRIATTSRNLAQASFCAAIAEAGSQKVELGSIVEYLSRGITPRYTEDDSQLRVLNQKCIRDGRVSLTPSRRTVADRIPAMKMLRPHDVLVNSTGVGTLGRLARWTNKDPCTVDSHITIVRFDPGTIDPVCAGFGMLAAETAIEALGEGSTGQTELSRTQLAAIRLLLPSRDKALQLRPKLDALENRADSALEESLTLARLRDTLLPKLMSGEIRVRDAEKAVGEAT